MAYNRENHKNYQLKWLSTQPDDVIRVAVRNHYLRNKDKIMAYKKKQYQYKIEVKRLFKMFDIY